MIRVLAMGGVAAVVGSSLVCASTECEDYRTESYAHIVNTVDTARPARAIAEHGRFVYVGLDSSGVEIFDVANPLAPRLVGSFATVGEPTDIAIANGHAFVTEVEHGLEIFAIPPNEVGSTFGAPELVGTYPISVAARGVDVGGSFAYVAASQEGVHILDVADPTSPAFVEALPVGWSAYDVALHGDLLYIGANDPDLQIYDVSDPRSPLWRGQLVVGPEEFRRLVVRGSIAYVLSYQWDYSGLGIFRTISVANPGNPQPIGALVGTGVSGIAVEGSIAYVSDGLGLGAIDVSNPISPESKYRLGTGLAYGIVPRGEIAIVASTNGLVVCADVTNLDRPQPLSQLAAEIRNDVFVEGELLYACVAASYGYQRETSGGACIFDVSDATAPVQVGTLGTGIFSSLDGDGEYLYAGDTSGELEVFDPQQPAAPVGNVDLIRTSGYPVGPKIRLHEDLVHVAAWNSAYQIVDVSDPTTPVVVSHLLELGGCLGVAPLEDGHVLLARPDEGLVVVDATDPANPWIVARDFTRPGMMDVFVAGDVAYGIGGGHLVVVDVSDPTVPALVGETPQYGTRATATGPTLYVLSGGSCTLYDISRHRAPRLLGTADGFLDSADGIVPFEGGFIVGGGRGHHDGSYTGFIGIFAPPCESPAQIFVSAPESLQPRDNSLSRPRPNPFAKATRFDVLLSEPESVELGIFDVAGRRVRDLSGEYARGVNRVRWEGLDATGWRVPGGVYFVRMKSAAGVSTRKVVVRPE